MKNDRLERRTAWPLAAGSYTGLSAACVYLRHEAPDDRQFQTMAFFSLRSLELLASGERESFLFSFQLLLPMIKHRSDHNIGCSANQRQWMSPINYAGWLDYKAESASKQLLLLISFSIYALYVYLLQQKQ